MVLAGMPIGRPSDRDPEAWFRLAVQMDQNQAADDAFHGHIPIAASATASDCDRSLLLMETDTRYDACQMDTNELLKVLESRVVEQGCPTDQEFRTPRRIACTKPVLVCTAHPLPNNNPFFALEVPEADAVPALEDTPPETPEAQLPPLAEPRNPRRPKWERCIARKLVIRSLEKDPRCIMVTTHLKTMDTMEEASTEAMVDTGTTGDFVDQDFVTQAKLPT